MERTDGFAPLRYYRLFFYFSFFCRFEEGLEVGLPVSTVHSEDGGSWELLVASSCLSGGASGRSGYQRRSSFDVLCLQ